MGLISLLIGWSHSRKDKSFRLKRKTVKRPETDVHILGCGISRRIFLALDFAKNTIALYTS